jgi:hypothetical protein
MPNSLKCRLKKLAYQGLLSEKDLSRIYTDNDVVAELEKIRAEIEELIQHCDTDYDFDEIYGIRQAIKIIDKHIKEKEK